MEKKHKEFILNELIPFIRRNEGKNFVMDRWIMDRWEDEFNGGCRVTSDGVARTLPQDCGTASCIGGSAQILINQSLNPLKRKYRIPVEEVGQYMGLDNLQARGLFMHWRDGDGDYGGRGWPQKFRECFAKAETAECKAEIACRLLELVVETEGKCLEPGYDR